MKKNFWHILPKPFFALAPMADVTDVVFREMFAKYGAPDVFWTEFVSVDGLVHKEAREHLLVDLRYTENQRPIVAQVFGGNPDHYPEALALIEELGFDGVDINMGCPDRSIEKQGAGAALIKSPAHAKKIIRVAKESTKLPVSVKTRVGYNKDEIDSWIPALLEEGLSALTVHARTRKEMSKVPARWEDVARVVLLAKGTGTLIIGNGDVKSVEEGKKLAQETGADGVMIGRGAFGNPWLFTPLAKDRPSQKFCEGPSFAESPSLEERLHIMVEHTKRFEEELGPCKNFAIMKKHYKAYVEGFSGAKELRAKLMDAKDAAEVSYIVDSFLYAKP